MSVPPSSAEVTRLLRDWRAGDVRAHEELWPIIYGELKKLAHHILRERRGNRSLFTTTLVHELYLRLWGNEDLAWNDRGHFFAIAARAMRFILVDQLRRSGAAKRGGGAPMLQLDEAIEVPIELAEDLVGLDDALKDFERFDQRKCQIVELSYFAGLTYNEIGMALDISPATVKRDLRTAKMWLLRELRKGEGASAT